MMGEDWLAEVRHDHIVSEIGLRKDAFAGQRQRIKNMKPSAKSREWVFFRDESGRIAFNPKCSECAKDCKQSFRATLVRCPVFVKSKDKDGGTDNHSDMGH